MKTSKLTQDSLNLTLEYCKEAQRGSQSGMDALTRHIHERLFRFCLWLTGNREKAEDLCQDAMVKVIEHIHQIHNPECFTSWLFRITRNHFLDFVRSSRNKLETTVSELPTVADSANAPNVLTLHLANALNRICLEDKYLFLLVCLEEQTYNEAAKILGISEDAVRLRLFRLRRLFRNDFFATEFNLRVGKK